MRGAARGGRTVLVAAVVLCAVAPAGAATRPAQAVLEASFGALIPAVTWVVDRPPPDSSGLGVVAFGDLLAPAFAADLAFAYVFPVGASGACCRLGPEVGLSWVYWDADDPPRDEWDYYHGDTKGGMLRVLVGMRLFADYDWGYVIGRLAIGPEIAALREEAFDERASDIAPAVLLGGGVGFRAADFLGIGLRASLVTAFHESDTTRGGYVVYDEVYHMGYTSLGVDLSVAMTWFF